MIEIGQAETNNIQKKTKRILEVKRKGIKKIYNKEEYKHNIAE